MFRYKPRYEVDEKTGKIKTTLIDNELGRQKKHMKVVEKTYPNMLVPKAKVSFPYQPLLWEER